MSRSENEISSIMRKVHSVDTTPELRLRKALWARGLRYRVSPSYLPGKPDIALPSKRLAVFIDGDYWHGNQWQERGLVCLEDQFESTKSENRIYWLSKIRGNMARDCASTTSLLSDGWTVIRFWESEINRNLERCIQMVIDIAENGPGSHSCSLLPEKTFAEFFAGIGLMRMGLEREGWSIVFANDIDQQKYEMYKGHFKDADKHFLLGDVHKIRGNDVPAFTLATASFPCNDLSLAGAREGLHGKESSAFWGFVRIRSYAVILS